VVHFFCSRVLYLFTAAASKSSGIANSFLSVAAVFGKPFSDVYAIIDLCLRMCSATVFERTCRIVHQGVHLQLVGLTSS
jgi:hypothetical protein